MMKRPVKAALLVVDVQRYYLEPASPFFSFSELCWPGSMSYIGDRVSDTVFPAVKRLKASFSRLGWPTVYLRLCSALDDRSDLHRFFRAFWAQAKNSGFDDAYPLADDPWAQVAPEIAPADGDIVIDKRTYSGFSTPELEAELRRLGVGAVVMTGLATSQCVDTTARAASDRGFIVVQVEDAQADYGPDQHDAALYASRGVCGGHVVDSEFLSAAPERLLQAFAEAEER